ncbi:MAG: glycerate kinase [Actinobacteria bacterium]|nr:glycerate kinase [Actinomycetota bacterium]MBI3686683.1 glycerate kinase [Actinomycetota bacterium]
MRVLVAPDSFKQSLGAAEVAAALAAGWRQVRPDDQVTELPLADGGEGTLEVIAAAVPGSVRHGVPAVTGPDGHPHQAGWLAMPAGRAVVELAQCCGIGLLGTSDPLGAHTRGLGEVIAAALDAGARALVVALGGSASTDGGSGALAALGLRSVDAAGRWIGPGGGALPGLAGVDRTALRPPPRDGVELLVDVVNPLLGPAGAAAVFGPQKGAGPVEVAILEAGLARWSQLLGGDPDQAGAGAAGGTGYGLATVWGARITSGAERVGELAGLAAAVRRADVVITGEGRLDRTSLSGKVTGHVARVAAAAGRPCLAAVGQAEPRLRWPGGRVITLVDVLGSMEAAFRHTRAGLERAGGLLAG